MPTGKDGIPVLEQLFAVKPIVDLIDPKAATDGDGAVFSQGTPVPESQRRTKQTVEKLLDGIRSRFPSLPPIFVEGSVSDVFGSRVPAGSAAKGASNGNEVFVFLDSHSSELDVLRTVFRKLFHQGLSKTLAQAQYIKTMLKLLADKQVHEYAKKWRNSAEGKKRKAEMPVNNWIALPVEKAFAEMSDELDTGAKVGLKHAILIRRLAARAADLAEILGLVTPVRLQFSFKILKRGYDCGCMHPQHFSCFHRAKCLGVAVQLCGTRDF